MARSLLLRTNVPLASRLEVALARRLLLGGVLLAPLVSTSCTDLLSPGNSSQTGDAAALALAARAAFDKDVAPLMTASCSSCHASMSGIDFMKAEPDLYTR